MTEIAYRETTTAVAVSGNVDSGKSSFIGVVISGKLDDGNGSARRLVAKHNHEIKRGKTSDISTRILDIPDKNQALTIIDLCGQADYFATTTFGLSGYFPDYAVLIVSANNGVLPMTIQHMRVLVSLSIPILVVVTRVDIAPPEIYQKTLADIKKMIASMCGKMAKVEFMNDPFNETEETMSKEYKIKIKENVISKVTEDNGISKQITYPVVSISNKTGYYIDVMTEVMKELPIRDLWVTVNEKYISENKIVKFFKQNLIQRLHDNFLFKFVTSIVDYTELHSTIKNIMKLKDEVEEKKQDKSTWVGLVGNLISSFMSQTKEQGTQNMIFKYCSQESIVLTDNQKKIVYDFIFENKNATDNQIKNYLMKFISKEVVNFNFMNNNMMTQVYKYIVNIFNEKKDFNKILDQLYDVLINGEYGSNITKMEIKQISSQNEIMNIFNQSCFAEIMKGADTTLGQFIFQKYQPIDGSVFYIDNCYNPPGIGLVITGINRGENVVINGDMLIGPTGKDFIKFKVKSMHNNNRENMEKLGDHNRGTIAISLTKKGEIRRNQIRKGMVAISSPTMNRNVCYRFKAAITVFSKSLTVRTNYTPVIHIGTVRQPARIILDPEENNGQDNIGFNAKSTNIAIVTFKFKLNPEFIEPYSTFLFRSGDIHGLGIVLSVLPTYNDPDANPDEHRMKHQRKLK